MTTAMPEIALWARATGNEIAPCIAKHLCRHAGWVVVQQYKHVPAYPGAQWAWDVVTGLSKWGYKVEFERDVCVVHDKAHKIQSEQDLVYLKFTGTGPDAAAALLAAGVALMRQEGEK